MAVDSQENIDHGKRYPLVAVDEWMVLNEAFQERCSFVNEGVVVTGLRSMKSGFERADVAYASSAAVTLDQLFVKEERVSGRDVLGHLANDRYNSSRSLRLS